MTVAGRGETSALLWETAGPVHSPCHLVSRCHCHSQGRGKIKSSSLGMCGLHVEWHAQIYAGISSLLPTVSRQSRCQLHVQVHCHPSLRLYCHIILSAYGLGQQNWSRRPAISFDLPVLLLRVLAYPISCDLPSFSRSPFCISSHST